MTASALAAAPVVRFLEGTERHGIPAPPELRGFGGLHGGLLLARAALAAREAAGGRSVTAVTGHFHRAVRGPFDLVTRVIRESAATTTVAVGATADRSALFTATVVTTAPGPAAGPAAAVPVWTPPMVPGAGHPEQWDRFAIPPEFVPVGASTEIRPVGPARPFAGGTVPELTAWIRIVDDDAPVDLARFLFLVDALAPSFAAVLTEPTPIPTVELAARPGPALATVGSPWALVRARTEDASGDGWHSERIDVWSLDGQHLGAARQLRVVRRIPGPPAA